MSRTSTTEFVASLPPQLKLELMRRSAQRLAVESNSLFDPLPWQVEPYNDWTSRVVLLTGSAGGGKSRLAAQKLHWLCMNYPGSTVLAVRKTRSSMINSTIIFLESVVIKTAAKLKEGKNRFEYSNGSIFAFGGMNDKEQREQVRSIGKDGGLEVVWMEEANAFAETDFNELLPRLRASAAPFRQILLSTNPDSPLHWIYTKLILGRRATIYYSGAADNTYNPDDYASTLAMLTGVERQRLVEGQWIKATGLVYDTWSEGPGGNVTEQAEYVPDGGQLLWAVDDGYAGEIDENTRSFSANSHPRVFLCCQLGHDGILRVFNEHYRIRMQPEEQIALVREFGYPDPDYAAVDKSAAALKGRLYMLGINTRNGPASVEESIKELRRRVSPDRNFVRTVIVHPRCTELRKEMASVVWDADTGRPVKQFDHGPDALRYLGWCTRFEGDA